MLTEEYNCEHFDFRIVFDPRMNCVDTYITYHYRHTRKTVEDYRGMLKAMTRLDERIGER